jgi:hypothetical protein
MNSQQDESALLAFVRREDDGHNMAWPVLVLYIAFPESKTPWQNLGNPESEQHAIATLFQCLRDFCSER